MAGSKKARVALQQYLKTTQPVRPTLVDTAPISTESLTSDRGYLTTNFDRGALILKKETGEVFRLSWFEGETEIAPPDATKPQIEVSTKVDSALDLRRALPIGEYTLIGYRLCRDDANGERWDLSATGPKLLKVKVKAGVTQEIKVEQSVRVSYELANKSINLGIWGDHGSAMAIYKAGKRIPVNFDLQDAQGNSRYKGRIRYA
ncbi:MAG: hypothetical protein H8E15_06465 [Planctomycetes bacterium]|nr:hypothetical protein [Planctomycetota bacterium]